MAGISYQDSGVDIDAGEQAVELMKRAVSATWGSSVVHTLSDFGGILSIGATTDALLVAGTDSVGSKVKVAFALDKHDTIGRDVVAMCVDDIICQGARPLLFLDYVGINKVTPEKVATIVGGVADGCRLAGCALLGGETAELPDLYAPGEYDLVGFAVGLVERDKLIDGSAVAAGDVVLALPSSGLHSNGYSLARKVLLEVAAVPLDMPMEMLGKTLGEELLVPTRIYAADLVALFDSGIIPHGLAHVTGGGIAGNLARAIPEGLCARVHADPIPVPPIFRLIAGAGPVSDHEMYRTFNMGAGMMMVLPPGEVDQAREVLAGRGLEALTVGEVVPGDEAKVEMVIGE